MEFKSLAVMQRKEQLASWARLISIAIALYLFALIIEGLVVFDWPLFGLNETVGAYQAAAVRVALMIVPALIVIFHLTKKIVELRRQVMQDPLTGLGSRACLETQAPLMLAAELRQFNAAVKSGKASRDKPPKISVCFFDIDGLKAINDSLGHDHGNEAIKAVGYALRLTFTRASDLKARLGGDEFVAITYHEGEVPTQELQEKFNENLRQVSATTTTVCGFEIAASMGQCYGRITDDDVLDCLLKEADAAMYEQKRARKAAR